MGARVGLFSLLLGGVCAQLEVMVDSPVAAQLGSQALLPCTFTVANAPISPEYLAVHWYFQGQELASYDDSLSISRPGVSMDTEQLASGNASLVLHNVTVSEQGAYRCLVIHSPDRGEQSLYLAVLGQCWRGSGETAVPTVAIPSKAVLRGEPNLLKCSVSGFHPADIAVTWLRAGEVLPASPLPAPQRNPDGTFNVSSSLTFQPTEQDQGVAFSCQVQHAALPRGALQTDFQLVFGVSPMVNIHAPTFVQGKAQVLMCDVKGFYPEAIAVNWLLNGVRTEAPRVNPNGTFNLESFYQFKPVAESEGAEISCEVQHETLSRPIVRSVRVHLEYEGTQVSVIVLLVSGTVSALAVAGVAFFLYKRSRESQLTVSMGPSPVRAVLGSDVLLPCSFAVGETISLPKFYLAWARGAEKVAEYLREKPTQQPKVKLFPEELSRGNCSLGLRNVSLEDRGRYTSTLIYMPDRSEQHLELQVTAAPRLSIPQQLARTDKATSFPCHVWGFYPGDVTITWLRDGRVLTDATRSAPQRNPDGTFNLTLTYTFTPTTSDSSSIFSCRVSHAALAQPLQEEFPLDVTGADTAPSKAITGVCIALLLVMVAGLAIYYWRWRRARKGPSSAVEKPPETPAGSREKTRGEDTGLMGNDGVSEARKGPEQQSLLPAQGQEQSETQQQDGAQVTAPSPGDPQDHGLLGGGAAPAGAGKNHLANILPDHEGESHGQL
ncbi:tyrosine-protein phosphatase non-receptor type substrate 1-like isoform X2 [Gopherus evgoodei]|uniref:tyrosine-protein phosphatase non-receptor type substrate 1-like isoform X2 n=1 Tax=Gopherus evgoodei TaxID=1825980 RepID=UPI0011D03097|nr:tyrosine-protein phosphatase non-receptor type substrate 1-like isoform X2 [Gopherus evgoodei]